MKRAIAAIVLVSSVALAGADQQRGGVPRVVLENPPTSSAIFLCGNDQTLPNPIPTREGTLILAGDSRLFTACPSSPIHGIEHRELRELSLLKSGQRSSVPLERWRAAQAIARQTRWPTIQAISSGVTGTTRWVSGYVYEDLLGTLTKFPVHDSACSALAQVFGTLEQPRRWQPGVLFRMLDDPLPEIQKEGAYAIGKQFSAAGRSEDFVDAVFNELTICVQRLQVRQSQQSQPTDEIQGLLLEAIGMGAYTTPQQRDKAEKFLIQQAQGPIQRLLGAARGLEALIRGGGRRPIDDATRIRLRELAILGQVAGQPIGYDIHSNIRMLAVQSLLTAGETDGFVIGRMAADDDWQVRRLVASRLDPSSTDHADMATELERDPAFQVRYDLVASFARVASRTTTCAPLSRFLTDGAPVVVMRALDSLPAKCGDLEPLLPRLIKMADELESATTGTTASTWHIPARALTALSRLKPAEAATRLEAASKNAVWQVRAAAVGVAIALQNSKIMETLAGDQHPNVQTAALDALFRAKNTAVVPLAINALKYGSDFQLLMTAARVLRGLPAEAKDDATEVLLATLRRLTNEANDMSRDPRVSIVERLGEAMNPARSGDLLDYVYDFDDEVGTAAIKAFTAVVGSAPADGAKRRRYHAQLRESEFRTLPRTALITTDDGVIELALAPDVAPMTVALFNVFVRSGAYNGKTLHRVVPNFVVQGGSPGANEYSGVTQRFMRDEVGPQARHIRGAVGISTRGPDTGDGQIFIDLVDVPRLDHAYTVFAFVTKGMEIVDKMLEGAVIRSVTVK